MPISPVPPEIANIKQNLKQLVDHPTHNIDDIMLNSLATSGITSALLHTSVDFAVQGRVIILGLAGKITKQTTPLCLHLLNDVVDLSAEKINHLVVLLGTDTSVDFSFYKLLTDYMLAGQIQSVQLITQTQNVCVDRGVDFIHKFTDELPVRHIVNSSLSIDRLLSDLELQHPVMAS